MSHARQRPFPGFDRSTSLCWLICAEGDRWPSAVRRFIPQLIPQDCSLEVHVCHPSDAADKLSGQSQGVVLWQIAPESLGAWCGWIAKTSITSPRILQLAAITGLSPLEQSTLSELGVAAMVSHPEQLPKLAKMIRLYFAQ